MSHPIALSVSPGVLVLDAFSHDPQLERVSEFDRGLEDLVRVTCRGGLDRVEVELERVERQAPQPSDRRVARAEIVQRDCDSEPFDRFQSTLSAPRERDRGRLGDPESGPGPIPSRRSHNARRRQRLWDHTPLA